jgi:hypothetical protein
LEQTHLNREFISIHCLKLLLKDEATLGCVARSSEKRSSASVLSHRR